MDSPDEFMASNDQIHLLFKKRRTKRHRLHSSTSSSGGGEEDFASSSSATAISGEISTEEEEDMANCLILLAQGHGQRRTPILEENEKFERISSKRFNEIAQAKAGFYVYECKTCCRTFPSFQALGGHRASHKKPRPYAGAEEKVKREGEEVNKGKVHECSICGQEFTSGQALGGHMRRHRGVTGAAMETEMKRRNILELDLNLPAPEEDLKFQFTQNPQTIVFSAPTLVDCHY